MPQCVHGLKHVFDIGKARIFAGSHRQFEGTEGSWDLRVRLAERDWELASFGCDTLVKAYNGAEDLFPASVTRPVVTPTIDLTWADYMVPQVYEDWWEDFVTTVQNWPHSRDVGISCHGGHGRTGSFLAIIAQLSGQVPAGQCPISWVRQAYCKRAVESWSQALYIQKMTGVKVDFGEVPGQTRSWLDRSWDYVADEAVHATTAVIE